METLTEALETHHQNLIHYDRMLSAREVSLEEVGRICPNILHFNDSDYNFQFLNEKACEWFCLPREQILKMGNGFVKEFYHPDTVKNEFPRIKQFYANNDEGIIYSNYHQIYNPSNRSFSVCLVFVKKCRYLSGFVSIFQPLENDFLLSKKMIRIISEELFKKNHAQHFKFLTVRECEIFKLLAQGLNNPQISSQLFISRRTVEQHRKNINLKLGIHSFKDILDYAYAFDLF